MMRGVPLPGARRAGLHALAGAGLWVFAGRGVIVDQPQDDTRADQRSGTWVSKLQTEISDLQGVYQDMRVSGHDREGHAGATAPSPQHRVGALTPVRCRRVDVGRSRPLDGWEQLSSWVQRLGEP